MQSAVSWRIWYNYGNTVQKNRNYGSTLQKLQLSKRNTRCFVSFENVFLVKTFKRVAHTCKITSLCVQRLRFVPPWLTSRHTSTNTRIYIHKETAFCQLIWKAQPAELKMVAQHTHLYCFYALHDKISSFSMTLKRLSRSNRRLKCEAGVSCPISWLYHPKRHRFHCSTYGIWNNPQH